MPTRVHTHWWENARETDGNAARDGLWLEQASEVADLSALVTEIADIVGPLHQYPPTPEEVAAKKAAEARAAVRSFSTNHPTIISLFVCRV